LDPLELDGAAMVVGSIRVVLGWLPRRIVRQLIAMTEVAAKLARVLAIFAFWSILVCWPVPVAMVVSQWASTGLFTAVLVLAWILLTLVGSAWGLRKDFGGGPRICRPRSGAEPEFEGPIGAGDGEGDRG